MTSSANHKAVRGRALRRAGLIFLFGMAVFAVPFLAWGAQIEALFDRDALVAWFAAWQGIAWLAAVLLLVSDLLLPVPNTVIMAALGVFYGPVLGGIIATLGNCLSGLAGYGLCRRFGRPLALRLLGPEDLAESERLFARSGAWAVVLSRWLPIVPEVVCCMAGLTRMRFRTFVLALVCGAAPLGFTVAALGYAGSDRPILTLAACALLPIPLWVVLRVLAKRGSAILAPSEAGFG